MLGTCYGVGLGDGVGVRVGVGVADPVAVGVVVGLIVGLAVGFGVVFTVGLLVGVASPAEAVGEGWGVGVGVTKIIFIALLSSGTGETVFLLVKTMPAMIVTSMKNPTMRVIAASVRLRSSMATVYREGARRASLTDY